ncbi:hypothetical protein CLOM621_05579 [Clostridium sp. M62/1]|nr:hypothetical protein CLOM621_05579 [Clostridium sp. M62/1]
MEGEAGGENLIRQMVHELGQILRVCRVKRAVKNLHGRCAKQFLLRPFRSFLSESREGRTGMLMIPCDAVKPVYVCQSQAQLLPGSRDEKLPGGVCVCARKSFPGRLQKERFPLPGKSLL